MAPRLRKDGRYECRITLPNGQRKAVDGKTAKEAHDKMAALLRQQAAQLDVGAKRQTVAECVRRGLEDAAANPRRPKTVRSYRQMVENHISPPPTPTASARSARRRSQRGCDKPSCSACAGRTSTSTSAP